MKIHILTVSRSMLGNFPVCQLVPEEKRQLSLNETEGKCLKTAKKPEVGGLILQLFLPSLRKRSHSSGFQRFSFKTSQQPDSISLSDVFSMSLITFKNHKKGIYSLFLLSCWISDSSHAFSSYVH